MALDVEPIAAQTFWKCAKTRVELVSRLVEVCWQIREVGGPTLSFVLECELESIICSKLRSLSKRCESPFAIESNTTAAIIKAIEIRIRGI